MKNYKNLLTEIDSKLSEVNDLVSDLYQILETEVGLENRDSVLLDSIKEVVDSPDTDIPEQYLSTIQNLEVLFN